MATSGTLYVNNLEFLNAGTNLMTLTATSDGIATLTSNATNVEMRGVATPTTDNSAVNKAYVDATIEGFSWKDAARAASTANVDISY